MRSSAGVSRTAVGAFEQAVITYAGGAVSVEESEATAASASSVCAAPPSGAAPMQPLSSSAPLAVRTADDGNARIAAASLLPFATQDPGGDRGESASSDIRAPRASMDALWPEGEPRQREPTAPGTTLGNGTSDTDSDASACRNCEIDLDDPPGKQCDICRTRRYCVACTLRCYNTGCLKSVCFDCYDVHEVTCPFRPDAEDELSS